MGTISVMEDKLQLDIFGIFLPKELHILLFSFLNSFQHLCFVCRVCKHFRTIASYDETWKPIYLSYFGVEWTKGSVKLTFQNHIQLFKKNEYLLDYDAEIIELFQLIEKLLQELPTSRTKKRRYDL